MPISSKVLVELGCPGDCGEIQFLHEWLLRQEFRSVDDLYNMGHRLNELEGVEEVPKICMDLVLQLVAGYRCAGYELLCLFLWHLCYVKV